MSEDKNNNEEKKAANNPLSIIIALFAVLALLLGYGLYNNAQKTSEKMDPAAITAEVSKEKAISNTTTSSQPATTTYETVELNIEELAKPRILGDINAPVKISEHSSFTCGHCGKFHQTNFKKIKEEFVDTGKAYIVFDDFPRNRPDLLIGAIARCVPEQAYFNFTQLVFETQIDWISKSDYIDYIKQNAMLAGATSAEIEACYESEELQTAMAESRERAYKEKGVDSTPTLIINETVKIGGMENYESVKAAIEKAYKAATAAE